MATSSSLPRQEGDQELDPQQNKPEADDPTIPARTRPFVIAGRIAGSGDSDKTTRMVLMIVGMLVLVVAFFALISTKGSHKSKAAAEQTGKPSLGRVVTPSAPGQLVPQDKISNSQGNETRVGALEAQDIEKTKGNPVSKDKPTDPSSTATRTGPTAAGAKSLRDVPPFKQPTFGSDPTAPWTPPPYSGGSQAPIASAESSQQAHTLRTEEEQYSRPSLVFVAHEPGGGAKSALVLASEPDNFGLQSGYHVAARLESMASTALRAPVTAVIEYNYDRDGQLLIPAGSRAVGKISQADASGVMNIVFDSLELPDGRTISISAIGATTSLQAIKGDVTGKNAGRTLAVRALAGMGSAAAMMVGQSGGALSQSDLIRQRASDNIGGAADAQVMGMQLSQHIVVSVPAGTEIYLIFTKSQKVNAAAAQSIAVGRNEP